MMIFTCKTLLNSTSVIPSRFPDPPSRTIVESSCRSIEKILQLPQRAIMSSEHDVLTVRARANAVDIDLFVMDAVGRPMLPCFQCSIRAAFR